MYKSAIIGVVLILAMVGTWGCDNTNKEASTTPPPAESAKTTNAPEKLTQLTIGIIPAENNEENLKIFEPMRALLEKKLGIPVKVIPATDYAGVIEAMRGKKIDIGWLGPLSYVLAEKEANAEAFAVQVTQRGEATYKSVIVVPGDSPAKTIADLKGKRMAFVDPASTSGALVPTKIIKDKTGLMPDKFFGKIIYAGGHDAAELAVKNKSVDAAADDDITYSKMLEKKQITKESNRILLTSDPIPGSPMAYRADLDPELKAKIKEIVTTAHKEIAQVSGDGKTKRWDAATPDDYKPIRDMVKELQLQDKDLAK